MQVLIYDGDCHMCSKFIRFVISTNRNSNLYITNFNSNWTKENLVIDPNVDSMIYISKGLKHQYSNSLIYLLSESNCFFKPILLLRIIPTRYRDMMYKILAANRRKLFNSNFCSLPSEKGKGMFLS